MRKLRPNPVLASIVLGSLVTVFAFQNCGTSVDFSTTTASSKTQTDGSKDPGSALPPGHDMTSPPAGTPGESPTATPEASPSASPSPSPSASSSPSPSATATATATATSTPSPLTSATPDCGNKILVNGKCVDFACQSVVTLTSAADLMTIPARTAEGVCYAYQLMSSIPLGRSSLTPTTDSDVISRNHDASPSGPSQIHNPYLMGRFQGTLHLQGPRVVKLAGANDATKAIKVDNFVLAGVFPKSLNPLPTSSLPQYFKAKGTSDSTIADASAADTHAISFHGQLIPVEAFATGGTASVAPIDISSSAPSGVDLLIDVRSEDCGGSREMSEVWLLFQ